MKVGRRMGDPLASRTIDDRSARARLAQPFVVERIHQRLDAHGVRRNRLDCETEIRASKRPANERGVVHTKVFGDLLEYEIWQAFTRAISFSHRAFRRETSRH